MSRNALRMCVPGRLWAAIETLESQTGSYEEARKQLYKKECLCFIDNLLVGSRNEETVFSIDSKEEFNDLPDYIEICRCPVAIWNY